eukprot:106463_1
MDSTVALLLTVTVSLILWFVIAPVLIYYTYKFWQNKVIPNDSNALKIKQENTLSVLLSFVTIINCTFSLPLITLIYIYYYEYNNCKNHIYYELYLFYFFHHLKMDY